MPMDDVTLVNDSISPHQLKPEFADFTKLVYYVLQIRFRMFHVWPGYDYYISSPTVEVDRTRK